MTKVATFTFNAFQENTYILHDESKECVIFDPGCSNRQEMQQLAQFIEQNGLTPVRLINTHCHIDHILGNAFVAEKYALDLEIHQGELAVLQAAPQIAQMYQIAYTPSPMPKRFIAEGETIEFGNTQLRTVFTPGHSPASLSFICDKDQFVIAGDVLFKGSIGRTDLPGGDMNTLLRSIRTQLFPLEDATIVYPGHNEPTTIGVEKRTNPFLT